MGDATVNLKWAFKLIQDLSSRKYYGKLIISIENGKITLIKKEESLKPERIGM